MKFCPLILPLPGNRITVSSRGTCNFTHVQNITLLMSVGLYYCSRDLVFIAYH